MKAIKPGSIFMGCLIAAISFSGCVTRQTMRTNNLGQEGTTTKTTYFWGIPVFEEKETIESRVPD